ncbi:MAG: hypothetical protein IJ043_11605 [Clostridia bacterium]|nr:hypothetical protein [Clostridia bacterium]
MNKIAVFFRKYGHKLLTFFIGLAFLSFCVFMLVLGVTRVYHMFKPENIYLQDPELFPGSAPFEEVRASGFEEGTAEYFELYIANFVKQDFPSFTDPLALNTDYFVSYGIWQAIKVNGQGLYAPDAEGNYLIPKADVEKYARYSFDFPGKIENHSVEVCGSFTYDTLSGCYKVKTTSMEGTTLVPDVIDVKFDDATNVYTLTVDCYYQEGLSEEDVTKDPTKFAKRISITMQKVEEVLENDGAETVITNYLYSSCALIDETLSDTKPGTSE